MTKKKEERLKCGMVSIVGRPNVGKSTLLNRIVEEKVAIVSKVPQTTRNQVRGMYNDERGQIIFIDTPGIHMTKDKLDKFMSKTANQMAQDADCIIHVIDVKDFVGREEAEIVRKILALKIPVVLALNKIDLKKSYIPDYIALWEEVAGKPISEIPQLDMITISAKKGINVEELISVVFEKIPEGPALYPVDIVTDVPQRMVIADVVREKFLNATHNEIPHSIAVIVESIEPHQRKVFHIRIMVLVDRQSQKQIVVGKGGSLLKKVGILARKELEELLGRRVFLEIFVKTKRNWRDDMPLLEEMGYSNF